MHGFMVVSQKEARVFVKAPDRRQIKLVKSLTNPLGMVKRRDLIRKQAGRGVKSIGRVGSVSYSERKRLDPRDGALIQFAREISSFLKSETLKKSFKSFTVVAEPHFLGILRSKMSKKLKKSVTSWIKKDLQKTPNRNLAEFLLPKTNKSQPFEQPRVR